MTKFIFTIRDDEEVIKTKATKDTNYILTDLQNLTSMSFHPPYLVLDEILHQDYLSP